MSQCSTVSKGVVGEVCSCSHLGPRLLQDCGSAILGAFPSRLPWALLPPGLHCHPLWQMVDERVENSSWSFRATSGIVMHSVTWVQRKLGNEARLCAQEEPEMGLASTQLLFLPQTYTLRDGNLQICTVFPWWSPLLLCEWEFPTFEFDGKHRSSACLKPDVKWANSS